MSKSPPTRGAWIEISHGGGVKNGLKSPPTRGAWIEIQGVSYLNPGEIQVAPHTGGVD